MITHQKNKIIILQIKHNLQYTEVHKTVQYLRNFTVNIIKHRLNIGNVQL